MQYLTLNNLAAVTGGTYCGAESLAGCEIAGVVTDSRAVRGGDLFVALRGERVDGHTFIPEVFAKGACAVLSEERLADPAGPYILVDSCPQALCDIAEFYRRTLSIPVIGVTGSVGKTGTKEMIASVLEQQYCVAKTEGNFNNEIGLPLTLLSIRPEHEAAVVEMGISGFGEMHRLAKMARPDVCVITNIAPCHLENLGDLDGVLRAKSELFDYLGPDGVIIFNGNDEKLSLLAEPAGIRPLRYFVDDGSAKRPDPFPEDGSYPVTADAITNRGLLGMEAVLHLPDGDCPIAEPIPGAHNIYNACAAACVGIVLGLTPGQIRDGIAAVRALPGRANLIETGTVTILDDCYNASPSAMRDSLDILARAEGRRIAVLGDMLELGEEARDLHRGIGTYAAGLGIDRIYCTGDLAAEIADAASAGGCDARQFATREDLLAQLCADIKKGDAVLVKASHAMEFSVIVDALQRL